MNNDPISVPSAVKVENTAWLRKMITDFVNGSPENCLGANYREKAWGSPLVGFSRGDDPYYQCFKEDIGEFLWTPFEIFSKSFPNIDFDPSELSVICWVLPQTEATKADMRRQIEYPAERAALSRSNGEIFNLKVGQYVVNILNSRGYEAVAPAQSEYWEIKWSEKYHNASSWSEKHAAFISGLGTFSLTDTLITEVGTAARLGSVVARIPIEPTQRKYTRYDEYCLHSKDGGCMKCADRCPAGAIDKNGHDKAKCVEYQNQYTSKYMDENYKINTRYCGLCQFDIPCKIGVRLA
jgi:ferredoxin